MNRQTHVIDLEDRIEEIDGLLADIKEDVAEIETEAQDLDPESDDPINDTDDAPTETERFEELEAEYDDLKDREATLEKARKMVADSVEEWGGSEFEFKELSWGDAARIYDDIRAASQEVRGDSEFSLGAFKITTVETAVVSIPEGAPDDARQWPPAIGEYIYEEIDSQVRRGSGGGDGLGNSSLREAISSPGGQQS